MNELEDYINNTVSSVGKNLESAEVFAKVLASNDDAGRHGVLVPTDAYPFFPDLYISDPSINTTYEFLAYDKLAATHTMLGYKYYERYPERRITRLNALLNDRSKTPRLVVFAHVKHTDGSYGYYFDCANSKSDGRFDTLFRIIFGHSAEPISGAFVVRPIHYKPFSKDTILSELLELCDKVRAMGWIKTRREGHTGIGYTFEELIGIKENNDQTADFKGIEIKCKGINEGAIGTSGKTNLFQQGPTWASKMTGRQRIRLLGRRDANGLFQCHSQVTMKPNNLHLTLKLDDTQRRVDLHKRQQPIGHWLYNALARRLDEKHSRGIFVKAAIQKRGAVTSYKYDEIIYCEKPDIDRFLNLVKKQKIMFEFLMSEKSNGSIRNHGYPWRLISLDYLEELFEFKMKVR